MFIVRGFTKFIELDNYENGCIGECNCHSGDYDFESETIEGLIVQLKEFTGHDDVLINSCDEDGRIDIQGMEDRNSMVANDCQLEAWRAGRIDLYSICYTFQVYKAEKYLIPEYI